MQEVNSSENLKTAYDHYYENNDETWRMLGAKYKVEHILAVCKGYTFDKVLEVGAGDGVILKLLAERGFAPELHAVELSASGVERIKERNIAAIKSVQEFDGYHLPFEDDSMDLIILTHVLEHVEHERLLLRELKRVAKMVLIEVPRDYRAGVDSRIKHFLAYGHINVYTPTSLRYLLLTEGFEVVKDLTDTIAPEVTRFYTFNTLKKPRNFLTSFKIDLEHSIKKLAAAIFGKKVEEQFANYYTVLCRKADHQPEIF
ncbi:class I SAM-dependent methyltransferase [Mucilaginibacter sp. UR6-11]|uniref:class I SAM-dependent methyltransferase n=1 Tax=Mucilaginibacter sp. UR6-11 TaxID=1435644 RepID=UPI001E2B14B0|nr:class I SAM-dependent methyltransferase [Mucilaginibacter sp. UR6-11]MCC8425266.1 class I SAM-dependent methyltransferase [Mucilaginibacter sp. UR6-11]